MESPIIITEIPRSGADMVALALAASGVWIGDGHARESSVDRSRFWNKEIQTTLVRPMLRGMNADVSGLQRFPDLKRCHEVADFAAQSWRRRIEGIIGTQGYSSGPWAYMASDAVMLWPVWRAAFPEATWVLVRRDTEEIVRSCLKNPYHGTVSDRPTLEAWIKRFEERFVGLREAVALLDIQPGDFIRGDFESLKTLIYKLGLQWNDGTIRDALTPILWGNGVFEVKGAR